MGSHSSFSRRKFVAASAVGATALGLGLAGRAEAAPKRKAGKGANEKLIFGLIGCGGMGAANMRNFMGHDDVEVAALCDVDESRIAGDFYAVNTKYGRRPEVYSDYRKMLERKDIDCVIIGTPDHWHALNLVHACEAGKDIYCEKPISHNLVEANAMMAAKRRFKRVVQVGTWQRSTPEFHNAMEYIRSGKLGKVVHCKAWINDGAKLGHREPEQPPAGFDYDAWIGPAKMVPYRSNCVHFNWRYIRNTGGGHVTDWGVHMMDIALLGMSAGLDLPMPTSVAAVGGLYDCEGDDRDCMNLVESVMKFDEPNFSMYWTVLRDPKGLSGNGTEWVNAAGETVRCYRGGWEVLDKGGKKMPTPQADPLESDHSSNFLDCVKSREKPRGDLESVGQSTVVCHLVNVAMESGETVKFDKKTMDIVGRAGKNTLAYSRTYRKGYKLPIYK